MILISFDYFEQLAEFDPRTGAIKSWSRNQRPDLAASIVGSFSHVNDKMVALYRIGGILHLWIADQQFELTNDLTSDLKDDGENREFGLRRDPDTIVTIRYLRPELLLPLEVDPTPGVAEEHFDYLLFVHNVLTQPGRRDVIWND